MKMYKIVKIVFSPSAMTLLPIPDAVNRLASFLASLSVSGE